MTLNLMLTSRAVVFLSGDFRISYSGGTRVVDDLHSQKLIPVITRHWSALVAFTGVAKTRNGVDVGDWIAEQISTLSEDAAFEELPRRLTSADAWLARMRSDRRLAFSVVGFIKRRPVAMIVSNFTDLSGRHFGAVLDSLKVSEYRPKVPEVYAAGDTPAVRPSAITRLRRMLAAHTAPRQIQSAIADANVESAAHSNTISKACVTGFLLASAAAEVTPHGIPPGVEYVPTFVQRELAKSGVRGFKRKFDEHGVALPPQWVGMTAKAEDRKPGPWFVAIVHAMRNVAEPVGGGVRPPGTSVAWKIVGPNERPPISFQLTTKPKLER